MENGRWMRDDGIKDGDGATEHRRNGEETAEWKDRNVGIAEEG